MTPLQLWERGLNVISIPRPDDKHDGKTPAGEWKQWQTFRMSRRMVEAIFEPRMSGQPNVAVITGAVSGIVVVDLDSDEATEWWCGSNMGYTPWSVVTSKGSHKYYRHPGVPVRNRARLNTSDGRLAIDVRGDGGYVIGPGSVHKSGHVYQAVGDWSVPRDKLPVFPVDLLATPEPVQETRPQPAGDAVDRARAYLRAVPEPVIGCGSDALTFAMACRLVRGLALDEDTALGLLQEWAPHFDLFWLREKIRSAVRHGREPIGGMLAAGDS